MLSASNDMFVHLFHRIDSDIKTGKKKDTATAMLHKTHFVYACTQSTSLSDVSCLAHFDAGLSFLTFISDDLERPFKDAITEYMRASEKETIMSDSKYAECLQYLRSGKQPHARLYRCGVFYMMFFPRFENNQAAETIQRCNVTSLLKNWAA